MMCSKSIVRWHRALWQGLLVVCLVASTTAEAGDLERQRARQMFDRLAGVPPTNAEIDQMETLLLANNATGAAGVAMAKPTFYSVTIKNMVAPWTNEAQDVFVPLNDYTATVIGLIRDSVDFRQVLSGDVVYVGIGTGIPAYSSSNNANYEKLEAGDTSGPYDLSVIGGVLQSRQQSLVTSLPAAATAGVMTTRAAAEAFFSGGTNRLMLRSTLMHHLCTDLEPLKDVTRVPDRVRRDVARSPGGDSRIFLNSCVGCHAGMDGMAGAFARYEYDEAAGVMQYQAVNEKFDVNGVALKYNINPTNFSYGYVTTNDSWINYWRKGHNFNLGWDTTLPASGNGAKSLGTELANTRAFSTCQVKKVFKAVCFRDSDNYLADRTEVGLITDAFESDNYKMKNVFARVAAYCTDPSQYQ